MQKRVGKWVSHNKVLVGSGDSSKKPHARNPNFDSEETKLLIQLWGDPQVQKTLVTVHKKHPVISKIADKMRLHGYNRTTEEINTRIKNLKCLYNRIKKDLDSGLLNEPSWKHYNAMHEIISRPIFGNSVQMPPNQKIVISPSIVSNNECSMDFQIKEEEEDDNDSMDYDEQELRPEDLLTVEEERIDNIPIKSEPTDDDVVIQEMIQNQQDVNNSNIESSCKNEKLVVKETEMNATSVQQISSYQQNSTNNTGNKISIVPTKLLLKPPATILPKPSVTNQQQQQSQQQSHVPMKLLFVNTNSNAQNKITTSTTMGRSKFFHHDKKMNLIRTTLCGATSLESSKKDDKKEKNEENLLEENEKTRKDVKFPTIKNILNNIHKELKMKNKIELERNDIERQRFELEKTRLEYEKSIGSEILYFLSNFTKSNDNLKANKE